MNQRLERVNHVAAFLRPSILSLVELCEKKLGRKLLIVHGWRSVQEQYLLYQQGRIWNPEAGEWEVGDASKIVTKAKPGSSAHNIVTLADGKPASLAVDVIPFDSRGNADWNVGQNFWDALYDLAWRVGLDPLGDKTGAYLKGDLGHFEEPGWKFKCEPMGLILPSADVIRHTV